MEPGQDARSRAAGGEPIPPLHRARRTRVAIAIALVALAAALGGVVGSDAGAASNLAWYGTAVALAILAIGLGVGSMPSLHAAIGLLGVLLLLRRDERLALAPLYGAGLLVLAELGRTYIELRDIELIGAGTVRARLTTIVAIAGRGTGAAALVALAATSAPARSVGFSVVGTAAVVAAFAGIVLLARHVVRRDHGEPPPPRSDDEA